MRHFFAVQGSELTELELGRAFLKRALEVEQRVRPLRDFAHIAPAECRERRPRRRRLRGDRDSVKPDFARVAIPLEQQQRDVVVL